MKAGFLGSKGGEAVELRPVPSSDQFLSGWFCEGFLKKKKHTLWGSSLVIGYFELLYFSLTVFSLVPGTCSLGFLALVPGMILSLIYYLGAVPPWSVRSDILSCWLGCLYGRSDQTVSS